MGATQPAQGRRQRAKDDKRLRIMSAARSLFAEFGVGNVTTQRIADRADVAIGTLYLYASTKAELLIMVQNDKFASAIDTGLSAAAEPAQIGTVGQILALVEPVVLCIREQPENGRTYLHELVFGDPTEPHRAEGLTLALRLEDGITEVLTGNTHIDTGEAATLARVVTAILHVTTTATIHLSESPSQILEVIEQQVTAILASRRVPA